MLQTIKRLSQLNWRAPEVNLETILSCNIANVKADDWTKSEQRSANRGFGDSSFRDKLRLRWLQFAFLLGLVTSVTCRRVYAIIR